MLKKLFINYAREDISYASKLAKRLMVLGYVVWFDKQSLIGGQDWSNSIQEAIKECDFFIALLSEHSVNKKGVVQKEIKEALKVFEELPEGESFILPVRLSECKPSYKILQNIQWIDMFPNWEDGLKKIKRAIEFKKGDIQSTFIGISNELLSYYESIQENSSDQIALLRLSPIFEDSLQHINIFAKSRTIQINVKNLIKNIIVESSKKQLELIFFNIFTNAIKYSYTFKDKTKAWVEINAFIENTYVKFICQNFGVPITQSEVESKILFQKGTRGQYASLRDSHGMGIGLWVAKEVINKLNGRINITSLPARKSSKDLYENEPYLTTVTVELPIAGFLIDQ